MGLLSTNLKTADNIMVRIPNENLMKSEIANLTRFSIRRFEVSVGVDYSANLNDVKNILVNAASSVGSIMKDPAPSVAFNNFGENSLDLIIYCWTRLDYLPTAKFDVAQAMKAALDAAEINIPFPQRVMSLPENISIVKKT